MLLLSKLKTLLNQTLLYFNWSDIDFELWVSKDAQFGHFVTNVVFLICQKYHLDVAATSKKIIEYLSSQEKNINKITAKKGFLYLFVFLPELNQIINEILSTKTDFGRCQLGQNKTINYEWVSANPTGYLHLGHARNVFVGQAITKILTFVGYRVTREFYINDYGNQIYQLGKSVFYHYQKLQGIKPVDFPELYLNNEIQDSARQALILWQKTYQNGNFDHDVNVQQKFITFAKDFFLKKMQEDLASFGVKFDVWFSEKSFYENNQLAKIIESLNQKKAIYKKDGALWFQATKYGNDQDFVLIKSNQLTTYFVGDIMYHHHKFTRGYDLYIDLFGADHHSHYLKIKSGLKALGWDVNKFTVDLLQMVKIVKDNQILKISKRQGTSIPLTDLVATIGLDFLRFMLLSRQKETKFVFDLNLIDVQKKQNPFFYVQYAHARSCQLLAKVNNIEKTLSQDFFQLTSIYEQNLILCLYQFPIFVKSAAVKREPQILINYALNLSKCFHALYEKVPILNIDPKIQHQRVQLIQAFQQVLQNNLYLLDIKPKTKM